MAPDTDTIPPIERTDADPRGLAALATAALVHDADEAPRLLARLAEPPAGRPSIWLRAGDLGLAVASGNGNDATVGHLELVAVHPAARRRGIGRALVTAAERALASSGVRQVRWAGNPPCYGWPGIDVRYTPAICLAQATGYDQYRAAQNMTVDLTTADLDTGDDEKTLAAQGILLRRATAADLPALGDWAERTWNASWRWEIEQAVLGGHAGAHVAWRGDAAIAFASYGANRPSWFGPMGTDPDARNLGLGRVLLRRCLADQRDAGHRTAQIGWVGPISFYARTVGAHLDRIFWLYRKDLPT